MPPNNRIARRAQCTFPRPNEPLSTVSRSFEGLLTITKSSLEWHREIDEALASLVEAFKNIADAPIQIEANINLGIGGPEARRHHYKVRFTSDEFDGEQSAARNGSALSSNSIAVTKTGGSASATDSTPEPSETKTRGSASATESTPEPSETKTSDEDEDEIEEVRPAKRLRLATRFPGRRCRPFLMGDRDRLASNNPGRHYTASTDGDRDRLSKYIEDWHAEWKQQGGWLFDHINKLGSALEDSRRVQDVLGHSLNSSSSATMTELENISRQFPQLEYYRKTSADKVEAREERWRTSSATFHDQCRREREAAEKRMERMLTEQRELLFKIARASGVDIDGMEAIATRTPDVGQHDLLGAQLTRELNDEVAKYSTASRSNVDDNDPTAEDG